MARGVRKKIQSNLNPSGGLPQSRQYGRKNKEANEDQGVKKTRARRPPPPPFAELFIGAKENNPDLFDDVFSCGKQEQTRSSSARSPLAPLAVSGLHSYSNSLPSFNNDTFDKISKNRNTAVVSNPAPTAASLLTSDSFSQSDLTSSSLAGPLYASLAPGNDLYDTLDKTQQLAAFQPHLCSKITTKEKPKTYNLVDKTSNFASSETKEIGNGNSNLSGSTHNERDSTDLVVLSPVPKSPVFNFKTPEVRTRCRRMQKSSRTPHGTPVLTGTRLAGKLASMRSRRRQAAERKASLRENHNSLVLTVTRAKENIHHAGHDNKSYVESNVPRLEGDEILDPEEPPAMGHMTAAQGMSPAVSVTRANLPQNRNWSSGMRCSRHVVGERLTSTPSHHSSSRARRRGLQSSVTPLVARLHSPLDKLSPVLRGDSSQDVVLAPSTLFESPLSEELDDVFRNDLPSSNARPSNTPELRLNKTPSSSASDYDTALSGKFSSPPRTHVVPNREDVPADIASKSLKIVLTPLDERKRYSRTNSDAANVNERSETVSFVIKPSRRRRNQSIKVLSSFPSNSASKCHDDKSSKNVLDGESVVVKFSEQDLLKSSFFCEALRCSVVPSPVLTRRQRKARLSRIPSYNNEVSAAGVNKRRRRRDIRSLIPPELLLHQAPLLGVSSEEENAEGDRSIKTDDPPKIDSTADKNLIANADEKTRSDTDPKSRLHSETCDDVDLSFTDDGNQSSKTGDNLSQNESRLHSKEDNTGGGVRVNGVNVSELESVPEQQSSPLSHSCDKSSILITKKSSPQNYSEMERGGDEGEVSTVGELAAVPPAHTRPGKGWRRSLTAHARLSASSLRASSVGKGRRDTADLAETASTNRRSFARVSSGAGASFAALLSRPPSELGEMPPSPLVDVPFPPVQERWATNEKTANDTRDTENNYCVTAEVEQDNASVVGEVEQEEEQAKDGKNNADEALDIENDIAAAENKDAGEPAPARENVQAAIKEKALDNEISREDAKQRILQLCGQQDILQLDKCFSEDKLGECKKIGEGAYGEVFLSVVDGEKKVFKFMPIEGDVRINDETQKTFAEIYAEIMISMTLSRLREEGDGRGSCCSSYVHVLRCWCVRGTFTQHLLHLWDNFHAEKESENDRPDVYRSDQVHIVLEFAHAGQDLECYVFSDASQALALFWQVTYGLAVAEEALEFEHRDLHFGNVLVAPTDDLSCLFTLGGKQVILPTQGVQGTIIDFTMSRLRCADSCVVYTDLSRDPEIFRGSGDYQFDVYRLMKDALEDDWEKFNPRTNVLWLHYLLDKMISECYYETKSTSQHRTCISKLQEIKDTALLYPSARHLVSIYDDYKF